MGINFIPPVDPAGSSAAALAASAAALDAALKALGFKASVKAAATTNVTIASPGATFDTVTFTSPGVDSVLLTGQTDGTQNGPYIWNGSSSSLTRRSDADTSAKMKSGLLIVSTDGSTANKDKIWELQTEDPIILGTTALVFGQTAGSASDDTRLSKAQNLGDLTDAAVARTNLGLANTATSATRRSINSAGSTAGFNEVIEADTTSAAFALAMPSASANQGPIIITNIGTKVLTLTGTISGQVNPTLPQWESVTVRSSASVLYFT